MAATGISSTAITGSIDATLPVHEMAASGNVLTTVTGSIDATLPVLTMDASGNALTAVTGSIDATLPVLTMDASGKITVLIADSYIYFKSYLKPNDFFVSSINKKTSFLSKLILIIKFKNGD